MVERIFPPVYTSRGAVAGEDWEAVAAALNERMAGRRVGQQELATLSGVSVSTIRQVQHGAGRRVQNKTLSALSLALDWPEDHLAAVLLTTATPSHKQQQPDSGDILNVLRGLHESLSQIDERLTTMEATLARAVAGSKASAE